MKPKSCWVMIVSFIFYSLFCISSSCYAVQFPNPPAPDKFYVDEAHVISNETGEKINAVALNLWQTKTVPLFVVTIPSLSAKDAANLNIEKYATLLFNYWGIGEKENSRGILLLISVGDRKGRIELGKAYARNYDSESRRIMDNLMVPHFKSGDYSQGLLQGIQALSDMAIGKQYRQLGEFSRTQQFLGIAFIILLMGTIFSLFISGKKGWGWALVIFLIGIVVGTIIYNFNIIKNRKANRDKSGNDDRFDGGSSGGGGSTGSW